MKQAKREERMWVRAYGGKRLREDEGNIVLPIICQTEMETVRRRHTHAIIQECDKMQAVRGQGKGMQIGS